MPGKNYLMPGKGWPGPSSCCDKTIDSPEQRLGVRLRRVSTDGFQGDISSQCRALLFSHLTSGARPDEAPLHTARR